MTPDQQRIAIYRELSQIEQAARVARESLAQLEEALGIVQKPTPIVASEAVLNRIDNGHVVMVNDQHAQANKAADSYRGNMQVGMSEVIRHAALLQQIVSVDPADPDPEKAIAS